MYRNIPGNSCYKLSSNGVFVNSDGVVCELPIVNDKVNLTMYGKNVTVDLKWLILLSYYNVELPDKYINHIFNITFVKAANVLKIISKHIMVFSKAMTIFNGYRIIPNFTDHAVDKFGNVVSVMTGEILNTHDSNGYVHVNIYNPLKLKKISYPVHRLVGYTWIQNFEYEVYPIINHKDGNKTNNYYKNLEWCSFKMNNRHAISANLKSDNVNCKVMDHELDEVNFFNSLSEAALYIGYSGTILIDYLKPRHKPLFLKRYEIKHIDDESPWYYNSANYNQRIGSIIIDVIKEDGSVEKFLNIEEFKKVYGVHITSSKKIEEIVTVKYPNLKFIFTRHNETLPVQAYNTLTSEVIEARSCKELSRLLGMDDTQIGIYIKHKKGMVFKGYMFRYKSNEPWSEEVNKKNSFPVRIRVTNLSTKEVIEFDSLRQTSKYFDVDKKGIKLRLDNCKNLNGWIFERII